jgi:hypothetical protein
VGAWEGKLYRYKYAEVLKHRNSNVANQAMPKEGYMLSNVISGINLNIKDKALKPIT